MDRDFIGYGRQAPQMIWPEGRRLAVSIGINYEEGSERSIADDRRHESVGEVMSRVPSHERDIWTESFFEYGSRVGVWRLLDILSEYAVPATFFLCGLAGERNPAVAKAIVDGGHEPSGHGYRGDEFHQMSEEEQKEEIRKCVSTIHTLTGERPVGWFSF